MTPGTQQLPGPACCAAGCLPLDRNPCRISSFSPVRRTSGHFKGQPQTVSGPGAIRARIRLCSSCRDSPRPQVRLCKHRVEESSLPTHQPSQRATLPLAGTWRAL